MIDNDAVVVLADRWQPGPPPRLWGMRCNDCDRLSFPPRGRCGACWSEDVTRTALATEGHVYSATTVHVTDRDWITPPFRLGFVDLEDGIRILTHLASDGADIGSRVALVELEYGTDRTHRVYGFHEMRR